jgi:hypothetical protein
MTLVNSRLRTSTTRRMPLLKKLIWAYFLLLIFEGALRKWILPQLSAPLLVVRDPIAILIIWEAYRTHKWPKQWAGVIGVMTAGIMALCFVQLVVGDLPWFVAAYGLRSYLLPFPVAFILGDVLDEEDLRKFGNWTLWILLPMTALEVAQYYAAPNAYLNVGASIGTKQLDYAFGHVRASGTFSYVTGPTFFLPLAAAFVFYGVVNTKFAPKWLLWLAASALVIGIPVTGSRTQLVLLVALIGCVAMAAVFGVSQLAGSIKVIAAIFVVAVLVSLLPGFSDATSTLRERLSMSSVQEGGTKGSLDTRVELPFIAAYEIASTSEQWFGRGIGIGSNAAASLLTGSQQFLAGETEVIRLMLEFGPPFGFAFMLFRFLLAIMIAAKAFSRVREHLPLAWFLMPVMFTTLVFGTLEQPTAQGFMVLSLGFSLAALKRVGTLAEIVPVPSPRIVHARFRA